MKSHFPPISITVSDQLYLKDPESSALGKKIVSHGIELIASIGFEAFTFNKLAKHIHSTEASIYRYFESKHKFLLYLTNWYWAWMQYKLHFSNANIEDPKLRLKNAIEIITSKVEVDSEFIHINEIKLYKCVIAESSKAYLTRNVDEENSFGAFAMYKKFVAIVSDILLEINPNYPYPHMLVTTLIEGAHHQRYFADHLPSLTDKIKGEDSISCFYADLVERTLKNK